MLPCQGLAQLRKLVLKHGISSLGFLPCPIQPPPPPTAGNQGRLDFSSSQLFHLFPSPPHLNLGANHAYSAAQTRTTTSTSAGAAAALAVGAAAVLAARTGPAGAAKDPAAAVVGADADTAPLSVRAEDAPDIAAAYARAVAAAVTAGLGMPVAGPALPRAQELYLGGLPCPGRWPGLI